jgi:hypothetical protein
MITKKHWSVICKKIDESKRSGFEPFIDGKRVIEIDLINDIVVTSLYGEPKTIFNFDSAKDVSYNTILRSVKLTNVSLFDKVK